MLKLAQLQQHFVLRHDMIFRRMSGGALKPVKTVVQGVLTANLGGVRLKMPEVAWALHYGHLPIFPVHVLDGEPANMAIENLMPVTTRRLRFHYVKRAAGFMHSLDRGNLFDSFEACRADWARMAYNFYRPALPNALLLGQAKQDALNEHLVIEPPAPKRARPKRKQEFRPQSPTPTEGRQLHWYAGKWVSVPLPIHPADDAMRRCQAILDGAVRMEFDNESETVLPVWGPGGKGAGRTDAVYVTG